MIPIQFIKQTVEDYFGLAPGSIDIDTRKREISERRQIAQFFMKEINLMTYTAIGREFNGKTNPTVINSVKRIQNLIHTDKQFRNDINEIRKLLLPENTVEKQIEKFVKDLVNDGNSELLKNNQLLKQLFCCD